MSRFFSRYAVIIATLLQFSATASAGTLDEYYLQQFGEAKSVSLQKALLSALPEAEEAARCGMPLKHGLRRDWNLLEQSTQKVLAKQLAYPALAGEATFSSGRFKVHYATTGTDAPPSLDISGIIGVPDWVETVAATFEAVYTSYVNLGYQPAPTSAGAPYDIYLLDLAPQRYYGTTNSNQPASSASYLYAFTSWIELDNNFTDSIYSPYTPLQSLQVTAAHEYHHAIQYGYNFYFDIWYAEATSTWLEDELYNNVNQLYGYIPAWFRNSTKSLDLAVGSDAVTVGAGYGRWIFNRYLSEQHGTAMIRSAWEKLGTLASPGGNADIPMAPVLDDLLSSGYGSSLGQDFFGFAKRVYTRDWPPHFGTSETDRIQAYSPVATYSAYPVNSTVSSPAPSTTLPHYSFAFYKLTPTSGVTSLTVSINKTSGIQTALFKNGIEVAVGPSSTSTFNAYTTSSLRTSDEVVLLIANSTSLDNHSANFSTDGKLLAVTEPITPIPPSPSSGGNGTGCFIATAAYGSYLHPQVQLLRNFRDGYLLTNAPGRAFVALYYRFSPPLAEVIARHPLLRSMARLALTPLVVAVAHPVAAGASLLLAILVLYRPLRRRFLEPAAVG